MTGRPDRVAACLYCVYSELQKWGFAPQGPIRSSDKRQTWHGKADLRFRAKFHVYRSRNGGSLQPQNGQNSEFCPQICLGATRLYNFYEIFSVCTRLQYRSLLSFQFSRFRGINNPVISIFFLDAVFSLKFSIVPSGESIDRIRKKLGVQKMSRNSSPCQVWRESCVARRL